MMSIWMLVAVLLVPLSVIEPDVAAAGTYTGTVDYVKDGDTIMLTNPVQGADEVRFLGIDTPETFVSGGKDPGNQIDPHGNAATDYLKSVLPSGTEVTLVTGAEEVDGFGRLLAYVFKGNMDVNRSMLENGHAISYFIWPFEDPKFEDYRNAMITGMNNKVGVWDASNPLEELPFEYRDRMFNDQPDKYVGNYFSKEYVTPQNYTQVPIEDRVFFFTEQDAQSAGYTCNCSGGGTSDELLIQEVYYDAEGNDSVGEYLEIYNTSSQTLDISGYLLKDNYSTFALPSGTTIDPGQYLVVAKDTTGFRNLFGFDPDVSGMSLALGNSGDQVSLQNPSGSEIDFLAYENYVSGWNITANTGQAIYRSDVTTDTDSVNDWNVGVPLPGK
ncbi:lamin tail domain-containing protein [Pseudalkalibacillus berkeleyi]|uniref:Lamin tail domain-containing protein n=1 Tax=Pseudalkalibacillus berkeleyi TaxID=1069813 RepID=A0ABS9GXE6_9BACL|nr:lamin tail domain-containing protein [Pseudalkalibacillus berkeleyi]MCF6136406.1 lamin tail domain-containing protein [Pseudalkalibacillus berkeleyi]